MNVDKKTVLSKIVGRYVEDIALDKDNTLGIQFNDKTSLGIYNDFSFQGLNASGYKNLIKHSVQKVTYKENEEISIEFDNGIILIVGLQEKSYNNGPEAMQLVLPNGQIVICN